MEKKLFETKVSAILRKTNVSNALLASNCNFPQNNGIDIGYKILRAANMPVRYALTALYGPIVNPTADTELEDISGFGAMCDSACIRHCITLALKWAEGDQRCEVGMKYPIFNAAKFGKTWGLKKVGEYADGGSLYEIWESPDKSMIWSGEKSRMGEGGYAGLIFQSFDKAIEFVDWFLSQADNYVKDIDMFVNRLGGIDINSYQEFIQTVQDSEDTMSDGIESKDRQ